MSAWKTVQAAFDGLGDTIKDVVTVDVVTLTGNISIKKDGGAGESGIDLSKIYEQIVTDASVNGTLEVVAFSHIEIDADSINFVAKDLDESQKALVVAHNESVKAAQETREGIIRMVRSFFK